MLKLFFIVFYLLLLVIFNALGPRRSQLSSEHVKIPKLDVTLLDDVYDNFYNFKQRSKSSVSFF